MSLGREPGLNRLLIRSSLGRTKPTNYDIPEDNFVYGRLTATDPEKADDLMYKWNYYKNSENKNIGKTKDLATTNKKAVKNLLSTARQNYEFRKTHTQYKPVTEGSKKIKIYLPEDGFRYGKPGELEDPIKLLLSDNYWQEQGKVRDTMYETKIHKDITRKKVLSCHITKNHNLVKRQTAKKMAKFEQVRSRASEPRWKLTKFSLIDSKVDHDRKNLPKNFRKESQQSNSEHDPSNGSRSAVSINRQNGSKPIEINA